MHRIMIVDDHELVRSGLRAICAREPDLHVVGEADCADRAAPVFDACHPHLVLLDLGLPEGSGLELLKEFLIRDPKVRVLICSMQDEFFNAEEALRAGAHGYVNKGAGTEEILAAVRRVLDSRLYLSEQMTERMLSRTVGTEQGIGRAPAEVLSSREMQVFEDVGRGLGTRETAERLGLSIKTIKPIVRTSRPSSICEMPTS